ncbi:anti-sigma factor (plasmid) [Skermanella mucosa]|uniref:anti-sigma factor family protein n=1 Tax=Skermanella mucosa TaxID=1789672 RepID=UPI00192C468B|nr:anti-sigma factor [Skermanella mucosa]UEM25349.1 anti-sigma factor [Skermanella mucosa]
MVVDDDLLAAYVDGELDSDQLAEVGSFLAKNEGARRKVEELRAVTARLRTHCSDQRFGAPPERFLALADPDRPAVMKRSLLRTFSDSRWRRHALAASLLLLIGGNYVFDAAWRWSQEAASMSAEILEEIAEYHIIYAREKEHLVEVPAARKTHIEQWLGNRLDRELIVPDLSRQGLDFAGARMLVLAGNPVAQLIYTRSAGAPVALCITVGEPSSRSFAVEKHHGINVGHWNENGYTYVVVGAMSKDDVWRVAAEVEVQL